MPRTAEVISNWHHSVEDFNTSALAFYDAVEGALRVKQAPDLRTERVEWSESGVLSAKRVYLRVSYGRLSFDVCAAPFGADFFFSWWLVRRAPEHALAYALFAAFGALLVLALFVTKLGFVLGTFLTIGVIAGGWWAIRQSNPDSALWLEDVVLATPLLGDFYRRFVAQTTYYSTDTRIIFEETVKRVVADVVGGLLTIKNLPPLSPISLASQQSSPAM
ncbi:MAG: hypothetical protein JOZ54_24715 [Acidobacteria bacterium]|nr:hypothetical protein [Acidobacteriota bacterium]